MGIKNLSIVFDQSHFAYVPGQMLTGRVELVLDKSKTLKRIKLKFKGQARVEWTEDENETDAHGNESRKTSTYSSSDEYLDHKIILDEKDEENFTLPPGKHSYPFAITLPKNIPSSFEEITGKIEYFAQVEIAIPGQMNKIKKEFFRVKNYLNLNDYPDLKAPTAVQKFKKFYILCCVPSGRLTICARLPKSAFVVGETVPILLEINNESGVEIKKINAHLIRRIDFKTKTKTKHSRKVLKSYTMTRGNVSGHTSNTWTENVALPEDGFPYLENCNIIILKHEIQLEAKVEGMHCDLDVFIPITIGDISYGNRESQHEDNHFLMPSNYEEQGTSNLAFIGCKYSDGLVLSVLPLATEVGKKDEFDGEIVECEKNDKVEKII